MRDKALEKIAGRIVDEFIKLRKEQGLSHERLAQKVSLSRAGISFIESKKRTPTILTCLKIAQALNVSLSAIIRKIERE
jgi:DNA-binding XRE family transcriptional regulator